MTRFEVILTNVDFFSNVPARASVIVYSSSSVKPSHDEVKPAFVDKYGTYSIGLLE